MGCLVRFRHCNIDLLLKEVRTKTNKENDLEAPRREREDRKRR
jgi:hypothetical protein